MGPNFFDLKLTRLAHFLIFVSLFSIYRVYSIHEILELVLFLWGFRIRNFLEYLFVQSDPICALPQKFSPQEVAGTRDAVYRRLVAIAA